jgi:hypothetical protein
MSKVQEILESPKYQNQVFKEGTQVTMDSKLFVELLQLHSTTAGSVASIHKLLSFLQHRLNSLAEPLTEEFAKAVDQGLTETKKTEDGSVTEPIQQ